MLSENAVFPFGWDCSSGRPHTASTLSFASLKKLNWKTEDFVSTVEETLENSLSAYQEVKKELFYF